MTFRTFQPYRRLLLEVIGYVERSVPGTDRAAVRILDVACGNGAVAFELARRGYSVVGVDVVPSVVKVARERQSAEPWLPVEFRPLDIAREAPPGAGGYDVLLSMHTLYWHSDPAGFLRGCQRALKPGGHAIFLTYAWPARVVSTFRKIWSREGLAAAVQALRWLVPTALFELFRDYEPHYMSEEHFHRALAEAGFDVLEAKRTFLAGISLLAWAHVARREAR